MSDSKCVVISRSKSFYVPFILYRNYCITLVTVAGREGPVRNSVLPEHLADLHNFIGLNSRYYIVTPSHIFKHTIVTLCVHRYYLKKRDTLATLIQEEVQQVRARHALEISSCYV